MERPTSGRRHPRAGSITVAELIKNRPTPVRRRTRDEAATEPLLLEEPPATVLETTTPITHRRPPARSRQVAKIAGLGVATAVLIGSVAAASIITARRQQADLDVAARPTVEVNDRQALLPNLFTLGTVQQREVTTGLPAPNKGSASAAVENPPARAREAKGQSGSTGTRPAQTGVTDNADLVRQYYSLLAEKPAAALGLLDSVLRQSDLSQFVASWTRVHDIRVVDVQQRPDGALLTVVDMVLPDGGTARVQQLLRVTDTEPRRITGAEIISAQRS